MAIPTVVVEFDAKPNTAGEFIIGQSLLGGSDTLTVSPRWVDISTIGLPLSGTIIQGRTNIDSPVQAGTFTLVCDNFDGNFDPDNEHGGMFQYFTKGMRCRVTAVVSAVNYRLFVGRLDSVQLSKSYDLSATLTFVDDLATVGATAMTSYDTAVRPETSGSRAAWLASLVPNLTGTPSISGNLTRSLLPTYGGGTILDALTLVVDAEAGHLFVDPLGVLTVTAHADDLAAPLVGTLSDDGTDTSAIQYEALDTASAKTRVVAGAIVDRYSRSDSNYPTMYGGDAAAQALYSGDTVSVIAPLTLDGDAQALATYYGTRRARPIPSIDAVTVNFSGQLTNGVNLLGMSLADQLIVHRTVPYSTGTQTIRVQTAVEGIRWDFDVGHFVGTFNLALSDITSLFGGAGAFTIGTSLLGGPDLLTAY